MTKPADAIKAVIDEALAPRLADQRDRMAVSDPDPLPVSRSDLLYVWDDYGNHYLDFAALMNPVGHRHPIVVGQASEHHRYYHFTAPQGRHLLRWPVQYARDLCEAFRGRVDDPRVLFCEGEREAVWQSLELACAARPPWRPLVLDTGWHSWLSPVQGAVFHRPDDWMAVDWDRVGALLLSPVDTDFRPLPVREWMLMARQAGVPVIVDESVTGFGRTGPLWGQESVGVDADLTVLGGPVGGGFPLGAVIGGSALFSSPPDVSPQSASPMSCAAGAATLLAVGLGVLDHARETATVLTGSLDELAAQFPELVEGHHGSGLLRGLRLTRPAAGFHLTARSVGLHLAPARGSVIGVAPPLIASDLEVKRGVDMLADALLSWDDDTGP